MQTPLPARERGATSLEYAGLIVIAAVILTTVTAAVVKDNRIETRVCEAIGAITRSPGNCSQGSTPGTPTQQQPAPDDPWKPDKCKTLSANGGIGGSVSADVYRKIVNVEVKGDLGVALTYYSDGSVDVTTTAGGSVGVGAGLKDPNTNAGVTATERLGISAGSTWRFDSAEEAYAHLDQLQQFALTPPSTSENPFMVGLPSWGAGKPEIPPPDRQSFTLTPEFAASLGLPGAEMALSGDLAEWTVTIDSGNSGDPSDDTITVSKGQEFDLSGQGSGPWGGQGSVATSMALTFNSQGQLVQYRESMAGELGLTGDGSVGPFSGSAGVGGGQQLTTTLNLDPADPDYAAQSLTVLTHSAMFVGAPPLGPTAPLQPPILPHIFLNDPEMAWTPMAQLLQSQAQSTLTHYATADAAIQAELDGGVASADGHLSGSAEKPLSTSYLGAPDGQGHRDWTHMPECF